MRSLTQQRQSQAQEALTPGRASPAGRSCPAAVRSSMICRISSWVEASMPVIGSSSSSTSASWARARAMNTRCCWPPESCPIWFRRAPACRRGAGRPRRASRSACEARREPAHVRIAAHHARRRAPVTGKSQSTTSRWGTQAMRRPRLRRGLAEQRHGAADQRHDAEDGLEQRALAAAVGPDDADDLAALDVGRDAAEHDLRS